VTGGHSPLRIGAKISSKTGVARGRIGGFARGQDGQVYALVARHVAFAEVDGRIFLHDEEIGTAVAWQVAAGGADDRLPMSQAICAIAISDPKRPIIVEEAGIRIDSYFADPTDSLDRRVRTLSDSDGFSHGIVAWVGSRVRIRYQGDANEHYSGAVEVTFEKSATSGLVKGDAGMPIVDDDGKLLGLAISGTHERCFVAPVAAYLEQHKLRLYRLADSPAQKVAQVEHVAAGLRDVSANLTGWIHESKRGARLFRQTADGEAQLVFEDAE
jgi:GAF domain-containing protein